MHQCFHVSEYLQVCLHSHSENAPVNVRVCWLTYHPRYSADSLVVLTHVAHLLILRLARARVAHSVTAGFQRRWGHVGKGWY